MYTSLGNKRSSLKAATLGILREILFNTTFLNDKYGRPLGNLYRGNNIAKEGIKMGLGFLWSKGLLLT